MSKSERTRRIRYAVVGQGYIAQIAVLPAFANARRNSELVALVSGDSRKLKTLARRYGVKNTFSYDEYDDCLRSGDVDAVFIALPNDMHREFTVRAARAGVHVLCEKPMAVTEADCRAMIAACERARVKLMIAYRLHFDPANLRAVEIAQGGQLGELRVFDALFSQQVVDEDNIRLQARKGGGPLQDIGIYCLNAARYLFRSEPIEVLAASASRPQRRFSEIEEMCSATLRFPGERLATFTCSFGATRHSSFRLLGTRGELFLEPAFSYAEEMTLRTTLGGKGGKGGRARERVFKKHDQFAPELLHFSDCILEDRAPEPSGLEGLADVRILQAIERAARTRRAVELEPVAKRRRPDARLEMRLPPVRKPELVHAEAPGAS